MVDLNAIHPGDMVKVVDKPVPGSHIVSGPMSDLLGTVVTVQSVEDKYGADYIARIKEDGGVYLWGAAAFELVVYSEETFDVPPMEDFLASLSAFGY